MIIVHARRAPTGKPRPRSASRVGDDASIAPRNAVAHINDSAILDSGTADSSVKLVGVHKGDVDGSWTGA